MKNQNARAANHKHSPSRHTKGISRFFDFLINTGKLVDKRTEVAHCRQCGVWLCPPAAYSKLTSFHYFAVALVAAFAGLGAEFLFNKMIQISIGYRVDLIINLAIAFLFYWGIKRIVHAAIFAGGHWIEADVAGHEEETFLLKAELLKEQHQRNGSFGLVVIAILLLRLVGFETF